MISPFVCSIAPVSPLPLWLRIEANLDNLLTPPSIHYRTIPYTTKNYYTLPENTTHYPTLPYSTLRYRSLPYTILHFLHNFAVLSTPGRYRIPLWCWTTKNHVVVVTYTITLWTIHRLSEAKCHTQKPWAVGDRMNATTTIATFKSTLESQSWPEYQWCELTLTSMLEAGTL